MWGIYEFVSDYQNHNVLIGVSLIIGRIGNECLYGLIFDMISAGFAAKLTNEEAGARKYPGMKLHSG